MPRHGGAWAVQQQYPEQTVEKLAHNAGFGIPGEGDDGTGLAAGAAAMAALGVSDPRSWSATAWLSDAVPHLAYGLVTAAVIEGLSGTDRDPG